MQEKTKKTDKCWLEQIVTGQKLNKARCDV